MISAGDAKQWHASVGASVSSLASKHSGASSSQDNQPPSDNMHTQSDMAADCNTKVPTTSVEHDHSCLAAAPATEAESSQAVVLQPDGTGLSPLDDALLQLVLQTLTESSLEQVQQHQQRQQHQQQQLQQEAIERQLALQLLAQSSLQQMQSHATQEQKHPSADVDVSEAAEQLLASLDQVAPPGLTTQQSQAQLGVGASEAHEALLASLAQTDLAGLDQEHQQQQAQQMLLQQQQEVYEQQQQLLEQQSAVHNALLQQQQWEQAQQQQQVYAEQQKLIQQQQMMLEALQQMQQQQQKQQQQATDDQLTEQAACPQQLPTQALNAQTSAQTTFKDPASPPPLHPQASILHVPAPAAAAAAAMEEPAAMAAAAAATEEAAVVAAAAAAIQEAAAVAAAARCCSNVQTAAAAASSSTAQPANDPVAETAGSTQLASKLQSFAKASSAYNRQAGSLGLEASEVLSSAPSQSSTSPQQTPAGHAQLAHQQSTADPDHTHFLPPVTAAPVSFNPFSLQPGAVPGSLTQAYYLVPAAAFHGTEIPMLLPAPLHPLGLQHGSQMSTALPAQSSALAEQMAHLPLERQQQQQQQQKKSEGVMDMSAIPEAGNIGDAAFKPLEASAGLVVASQQQQGRFRLPPLT